MDETQTPTPQSPVPPHFHKADQVEEKDLIPNADFVTVVPTWAAPEGTQVYYLNGSDFRIYRMVNGTWRSVLGSNGLSKVRVYQGVDQTLTTGGTYYTLAFNVDSGDGYDLLNEWDTSTYIFTAAAAGYYLINLFVTVQSGWVADDYFDMHFMKNGVEAAYGRFNQGKATPGNTVFQLTDIKSLAAGDTISAEVRAQTNGVKIQSGQFRTWLNISRLN